MEAISSFPSRNFFPSQNLPQEQQSPSEPEVLEEAEEDRCEVDAVAQEELLEEEAVLALGDVAVVVEVEGSQEEAVVVSRPEVVVVLAVGSHEVADRKYEWVISVWISRRSRFMKGVLAKVCYGMTKYKVCRKSVSDVLSLRLVATLIAHVYWATSVARQPLMRGTLA